jgi:hypothetical protein
VGAAPTKPERASTARWGGSGERDAEVYARNQRLRPSMGYRLQPGGSGSGAVRTCPRWWVGNSRAGLNLPVREATVKVRGVAVAMPQGPSWAPTATSDLQRTREPPGRGSHDRAASSVVG